MKIAGVAGAFPKHYFSQEVLVAALKHYWGERLPKPEVLDRLHSRVDVRGRYMSLPLERYETLSTWGEANTAWIETAVEIGEQAIQSAIDRTNLTARDINALFVVSVTGIASPSLDARLINRMNLCPNIKRVPIFGLGCVAGAAGISRAADYVRAYPGQVAALLAVELCSLTIQRDDVSMANLISAGLFGDGAAAVIVTGDERTAQGPEILATQSVFYPGSESAMGWDISEKGFQIVLSPAVPEIVKEHLGNDVDTFLGNNGLTRKDVGSWIFHTGGPKVLEAVATALDVPDEALAVSWDCLNKVGNISSVSVLLVLEDVIENHHPEPGTYSILGAMGPGFCSELLLLKW
ncbi:MAG TPA: 3-oxoacyl-[acyl-carrier-protein] synthase III C-terminal domain-containing protein [Candidatus Acidoferrales bacterium]|nr:3-oxoacyl-[acyl-carrier-protein] synthase III C-terminal domain-containing protein [Candidatus Acidoferrales bacterium]